MSVSEYAQVTIMDQARCLGCGKVGTCMEIGVKDGLSLACENCISKIFERARCAIESEQRYEPEDNAEYILLRIDPNDDE